MPTCSSYKEAEMDASDMWQFLTIDNTMSTQRSSNFMLKRNSFVHMPNLRRIFLRENIAIIENGAFDGLNKLQTISFENNNLGTLQQSAFYNVQIEKLIFRNNRLKLTDNMFQTATVDHIVIENEHFENIPLTFQSLYLRKLELLNNNIKFIGNNAFYNMPNLIELILNSNSIRDFETNRIFGRSRLLFLYLNNNDLRRIGRSTFEATPNLQCLYLGRNKIEYIEDGAFVYLQNLIDLVLTNNDLVTFGDGSYTNHLPYSLRIINLSYNNLTYLSDNILKQLDNINEISVVGNPWQCPCWNKIGRWIAEKNENMKQLWCADKGFRTGKFPVCVAHSSFDTKCEDDPAHSKSFSKIYYDALQEYDSIPDCLFVYVYT